MWSPNHPRRGEMTMRMMTGGMTGSETVCIFELNAPQLYTSQQKVCKLFKMLVKLYHGWHAQACC